MFSELQINTPYMFAVMHDTYGTLFLSRWQRETMHVYTLNIIHAERTLNRNYGLKQKLIE